MNTKIGRNDPCVCGSGKKYKNCCMASHAKPVRKKITAKWLNPQGPNLMNNVFGHAIDPSEKEFKPIIETTETNEEKA
jgi:hypothetical protein